LTKHPFYKLWDQGKLTLGHLQQYSKQYYHLEFAFPQYLSIIHSKCNDLKTRQILLGNLYEEELESIPHSLLWRMFQDGIGVPKDEQTNMKEYPETESTINTIRKICSDGTPEEGIAAMFAYEGMLPEVSKRKIEGLKKHYNISDENSLKFFTTHMVADSKHTNEWLQLLTEDFNKNNYSIEKLEDAARSTCKALNSFLDGVMTANQISCH
jgi:pyrroloquinoline-quinone synthase